LNVAKFHAQTSTKLKKQKHWCIFSLLGLFPILCLAKFKPTYVLIGAAFS